MTFGKYCESLQEALISSTEDVMNENIIFQQDNASCRAESNTKKIVAVLNIPNMD